MTCFVAGEFPAEVQAFINGAGKVLLTGSYVAPDGD